MKKLIIALSVIILTGILFVPVSVKANGTDVPDGYTPIYTIGDLYGINSNMSGKYILMNDIDMSETYGGEWDTGHGWIPIGYSTGNSVDFQGIFDGNGHKLKNLYINCGDQYWYVGLFAAVDSNEARIINLGLENVEISGGHYYTGAICGYLGPGAIARCYTSGKVSSNN